MHVSFIKKFDALLSLKVLQQFAKAGDDLESLQTLKMSRLSVSKVSKKEWDFILKLAGVTPEELLLPESHGEGDGDGAGAVDDGEGEGKGMPAGHSLSASSDDETPLLTPVPAVEMTDTSDISAADDTDTEATKQADNPTADDADPTDPNEGSSVTPKWTSNPRFIIQTTRKGANGSRTNLIDKLAFSPVESPALVELPEFHSSMTMHGD